MRTPVLLALAAAAVACGPAASTERVSVPGVDRLSGTLAAQEVELAGVDLGAVRGPAGTLAVNGAQPDCPLRRKVSGALVARSVRCVTLLGQYAALERARQFLLSAGAEDLAPASVAADDNAPAGLHYNAATDSFVVGDGPVGARVPGALNPGAVARQLARRQLRTLLTTQPELAEGIALFLGAAAAGDPGYLGSSEPGGDPAGELDLARPLPAGAPRSAVLAGALWAWADASGDLTAAARAALAASRALSGVASPAEVLSLVAGQLDGAERDQACAVFRARLHESSISACP